VVTTEQTPSTTAGPSFAIVCIAAACGALGFAFVLIGVLSLGNLPSISRVAAELGAGKHIEDAMRFTVVSHAVLSLLLSLPFLGVLVGLVWRMEASSRRRTLTFSAAGLIPAFLLAGGGLYLVERLIKMVAL
jgi:hypothetical protein